MAGHRGPVFPGGLYTRQKEKGANVSIPSHQINPERASHPALAGQLATSNAVSDVPHLFEVFSVFLPSRMLLWAARLHAPSAKRRKKWKCRRVTLRTLRYTNIMFRPQTVAVRGRDSGCPLPPAQTGADTASAHGSYLGSGSVAQGTLLKPCGIFQIFYLSSCPETQSLRNRGH